MIVTQAAETGAEMIALEDAAAAESARALAAARGLSKLTVLGGPGAATELVAKVDADVIVQATVGAAALPSTIAVMRASCSGSTTAPTSMHLSSGSPSRKPSIRRFSRVWTSSATPSCTSRRDPAQQTWPPLNQIASTRPSTAESRSASSNTMYGLLPPNSKVSALPVPAVARRMA